MSKLKVNIEDLMAVNQFKRKINTTALEDIEWSYKGKIADIPLEVLNDWRFCGLSNTDMPFCLSTTEDGKFRVSYEDTPEEHELRRKASDFVDSAQEFTYCDIKTNITKNLDK